jgi:hypothetical protein
MMKRQGPRDQGSEEANEQRSEESCWGLCSVRYVPGSICRVCARSTIHDHGSRFTVLDLLPTNHCLSLPAFLPAFLAPLLPAFSLPCSLPFSLPAPLSRSLAPCLSRSLAPCFLAPLLPAFLAPLLPAPSLPCSLLSPHPPCLRHPPPHEIPTPPPMPFCETVKL